jgi:polyhydroxyalkanoate synthesis regulator phasin
MIDQVNSDDDKKTHEPGPLYETSRRILLAAIGAVAFAQDEVDDFINRLVERGVIAEKDGKRLLIEIVEKRNLKKGGIEAEINKRVHDTLVRMDIPTKKDIDTLSERIAALTKNVEELKKSKE